MVTLFGTSACHLCELAEALLAQRGMAFEHVDISESDELFERYGTTIPVLRREDGAELNWPFDQEMLAAFLKP
ncbi:glutaredoxin family protein [Halioglobus maricola]|uniref:Glutaredoxin family protein n=1 Tax=Halioglobus maricola TaxID=2601894 RepID=A0A5P9NLM7_9GAMM|nr:glutaredoxin family protein [Halioglobus maricola]QFU76154.1 glutaredoxin family protein [Halioglobus maricola]